MTTPSVRHDATLPPPPPPLPPDAPVTSHFYHLSPTLKLEFINEVPLGSSSTTTTTTTHSTTTTTTMQHVMDPHQGVTSLVLTNFSGRMVVHRTTTTPSLWSPPIPAESTPVVVHRDKCSSVPATSAHPSMTLQQHSSSSFYSTRNKDDEREGRPSKEEEENHYWPNPEKQKQEEEQKDGHDWDNVQEEDEEAALSDVTPSDDTSTLSETEVVRNSRARGYHNDEQIALLPESRQRRRQGQKRQRRQGPSVVSSSQTLVKTPKSGTLTLNRLGSVDSTTDEPLFSPRLPQQPQHPPGPWLPQPPPSSSSSKLTAVATPRVSPPPTTNNSISSSIRNPLLRDLKSSSSSGRAGGIIKKVLNINRVKQSIPEDIRLKRRSLLAYPPPTQSTILAHVNVAAVTEVVTSTTGTRSSSSGRLRNNIRHNDPPTPLHELCARSYVTLEELWDCNNRYPHALRVQDSRGRYPLHILSENETLLATSPNAGQQTATVFCNHLMNEFPTAILVPDCNGYLPFFSIVSDWLDWAHDQQKLSRDDYTARSDLDADKPMFYPGGSSSGRLWFPRVEMWEEVEWCFAMLSTEMDVLGRNATLPTYQQAQRSSVDKKKRMSIDRKGDERTNLVESLIHRLPRLLPTVLLVEDDGVDSRLRALEMTIFRRILLCPEMVGMWLIDMLNYGGIPAQRAVDFLWMVSHTTIDDYTGGFGAALRRDWTNFETSRQTVFDEVSELKGIVATLVTLSAKEMERASSTPVIWHSMGNKLSRPFVLGLVLIDLVLHITLMFTFRNTAGVQPPLPDHGQKVLVSESIIYVVCIHYLIRSVSEAWAMWAVSTRAWKGYILNMWNIFGFNAILLTLITTFLIGHDEKSRNGLDAFIVGLLWIKVLAFLKVVNKDMATFIMALSQILYDIRFFLLVLGVCVFMFGDMFHIALLGEDREMYCSPNPLRYGATADFCSSSWASYLRLYAILLGDITLEQLTATSGTTILFVIFTLFGVIILLNVLIAIISDSYEKATLRGQVLFARARVMFVAQNESLERFLKPRLRHRQQHQQQEPTHPLSAEERYVAAWNRMKRIGRWLVLTAVLGTALFTEAWLVATFASLLRSYKSKHLIYCLVTFFLGVVLACSLWVVATYLLGDIFQWLLPNQTQYHDAFDGVVGQFNNAWVRTISCLLFGLEREVVGFVPSSESADASSPDHEWTGRLNYMVNALDDAVADVKQNLKSEIMDLKSVFDKDHEAIRS